MIDTTTPEGFRAARKALGFKHTRSFSEFIHANERTVKRWEAGVVPPHPTVSAILRWLLEGCAPEGFGEIRDGESFCQARNDLGLSIPELAAILDVDDKLVAFWEEGNGPPKFVWVAIDWMLDGLRPPEWPSQAKGDQAEARATG